MNQALFHRTHFRRVVQSSVALLLVACASDKFDPGTTTPDVTASAKPTVAASSKPTTGASTSTPAASSAFATSTAAASIPVSNLDGGVAVEADASVPQDASVPAPTEEDAATPAPEVDPIYAVLSQVFGTEGGDTFSYLSLVHSFDGQALDLDNATEITGRAIAAAPAAGGKLFVASDQDPVVTRYELDENDELKATGEVSFLNAGVARIGEYGGQFHFASDHKAYFFDGSTARIVVWDPTDMTYKQSISLSSLVFDNEILTFGAAPVVSGDKVMMFPGWRSSDNVKVASRAAVITLDTTTDTVEIKFQNDACGYVRDGVLAEDGWLYMATEAYGAAVHHLNAANAAPPCLLRFSTETGTFDSTFNVNLKDLFGGSVGGSLFVNSDNQPFLLSLDATAYAGPPAARPLASSTSWKLARLSTGNTPSVELVEDSPLLPGSLLPQKMKQSTILPVFSGREATELFELDNTLGRSLATSPGLAFTVVQVR